MQYKHGAYVGFVLFFKGYECEPFNNPADFFLDIINGDSTAVAASKDTGPVDTGKGKLCSRNPLMAGVEDKLHVVMASFYSLAFLQSKGTSLSFYFSY